MSGKDYKIVLAGPFASGRSTFVKKLKDGSVKKIASLKAEAYTVPIHTSAGSITFTFYDSLVHAKGGIPKDDFNRNAEGAIVFFDLTSRESYDKVPEWYDAVASANHRRGSEDIPILLVGNKLDGKRDMTPKEIDYPRKKKIDYMEISSKANYKIDDVLLYLAKKLLGDGTQLTDEVNWSAGDAKVDTEAAEKAMKEYTALLA
ncbi:P-loop containing nucleoside triphosphate hydrolase protein [Athelia psychrophila]|uniref:P-loop containing nucleoside triphosphate hydrolase protein n=1 Tax=Athelia psychrophila TaxID=1759441 RepID=A0A166WX28_9AGAM|nr:P-loop containing nucleoside triphosphate hydrolase protein [Fibularhizoctonia sp. CBS 109695]